MLSTRGENCPGFFFGCMGNFDTSVCLCVYPHSYLSIQNQLKCEIKSWLVVL